MERPDQEAKRHAESNGDITKLSRAFDGVAEERAYGSKVRAIRQKADAIPELKHEIGMRKQVGVAAADVHYGVFDAAGKVHLSERSPNQCGPRYEHAQII